MRLALVMPTIRDHAPRAARRFIEDAFGAGVSPPDLSLYFSIDPPLAVQDFDHELRRSPFSDLRVARCIDQTRREALSGLLTRQASVSHTFLQPSFIESGYASARNAGLVQAIVDENDFVLFVDDDVEPVIPFLAADGNLRWRPANFFASHLRQLGDTADITVGRYSGHISPLVDLTNLLPRTYLALMGEALSLANEVLTSNCLLSPPKWETDTGSPGEWNETSRFRRGHPVYGGNLGLAVRAILEGRVPLFFTPPGARGEDTFFGTAIPENTAVVEIDAPLHHDPFQKGELLDGNRPAVLPASAGPTPESISRFRSAVRGWIAYGPLFLRCHELDDHRRESTLDRIGKILQSLDKHNERIGLIGLPEHLETYRRRAEEDFGNMTALNQFWFALAPTIVSSLSRPEGS